MSASPSHVLASPHLTLSDMHAIAAMLGGMSGAALAIAIVGALMGWAASWIIDWLPRRYRRPAAHRRGVRCPAPPC